MEITNSASDSVIVGIRVQVGSQALERIPTFFEVFGRCAKNKYPSNMHFCLLYF